MRRILKNIFWVPIVLLLVLTIWIMMNSPAKIINTTSHQGKLDLSQLNHQTIAKLTGEWQYYDHLMIKDIDKSTKPEYVTIPHLFKSDNSYGIATYKLDITGLNTEKLYGIKVINEVSAYRMTVNGKDILQAGTVAYTKEKHQPEMKSKVGYFKPDEDGNAEILMEVSNFSYNYGGFWRSPFIGESDILSSYVAHQNNVEILLFTSLLSLGVFFLGLFNINHEFKPILYISAISILFAIRIMLTNNRQFYDFIFNISWDVGTRAEFLTGYLLLPAFILFFFSLDYINKPQWLNWFVSLYVLTCFIIMFFTPNEFYANLLQGFLILCVINIVIFLYIIIQGIRTKQKGAILILIGMLGVIPTALLDFYGHLHYYLLPFGTYFMIICFSIVIIYNVFQLKQQKEYLELEITTDPLTKLKNRYFLNKLIDQGLTFPDHSKYYVFFFDLNKLKFINDTYGHNIGDAVLVESAKRIQSCFQKEHDIVCRYAGDEFMAFIRVNEEEDIIDEFLERLSNSFHEPFWIKGEKLSISVSIGVSEYHKGDDFKKIIKKSDDAMYKAKKSLSNDVTNIQKV